MEDGDRSSGDQAHGEHARSDAIRAAQRRRVELKQALSEVEVAAAAPAGDARWSGALVESLEQLKSAIEQHAEEVEGSGGLLDEIVVVAPRLHKRVAQLRLEHALLIGKTLAAITTTRTSHDAAEIRADVLDALVALARHRQDGSDLVYEAYSIDIGGS